MMKGCKQCKSHLLNGLEKFILVGITGLHRLIQLLRSQNIQLATLKGGSATIHASPDMCTRGIGHRYIKDRRLGQITTSHASCHPEFFFSTYRRTFLHYYSILVQLLFPGLRNAAQVTNLVVGSTIRRYIGIHDRLQRP